MFGYEATQLNAMQCALSDKDHLAFGTALHWFNLVQVDVHFLHIHLVPVAMDLVVQKLSCLVGEDCVLHFISGYKNVTFILLIFFAFCFHRVFWLIVAWTHKSLPGGYHSLALVLHMELLCLFQFREELVYIFNSDKWQREIVPFANGFQPGDFRWETRCAVEIADCLLDAGEFIDVADRFVLGGVFCAFQHLNVVAYLL